MTLVALSGCGSPTYVIASSKAPSAATAAPMRRVLVMAERVGAAEREEVEQQLVAKLRSEGVDAHPGSALFPTPPKDHEATRVKLVREGYDGAVVVGVIRSVQAQCYLPCDYTGCREDIEVCSEEPVPTEPTVGWTRWVIVDTRLWDVRDRDAIVWQTSTRTSNPEDGEDLAKSLSGTVVGELARAKLMASR